jgi:hypoxanthine phosphoribosyltransferase
MNKSYLSNTAVEYLTQSIAHDIEADKWQPDYIVGITRGGLVPANLLSQYLGVKMYTLDVSLRDHADALGPESNCWMSEDALDGKRILIVDDINDSGETLDWIVNDWKRNNRPDSPEWEGVFGKNVRVATLINKSSSNFTAVSYFGKEIAEGKDNDWWVFPWEDWWTDKSENK